MKDLIEKLKQRRDELYELHKNTTNNYIKETIRHQVATMDEAIFMVNSENKTKEKIYVISQLKPGDMFALKQSSNENIYVFVRIQPDYDTTKTCCIRRVGWYDNGETYHATWLNHIDDIWIEPNTEIKLAEFAIAKSN